jgi:hypothetical protein
VETASGWLEPLLDLHLYISKNNNFLMKLMGLKQQQSWTVGNGQQLYI